MEKLLFGLQLQSLLDSMAVTTCTLQSNFSKLCSSPFLPMARSFSKNKKHIPLLQTHYENWSSTYQPLSHWTCYLYSSSKLAFGNIFCFEPSHKSQVKDQKDTKVNVQGERQIFTVLIRSQIHFSVTTVLVLEMTYCILKNALKVTVAIGTPCLLYITVKKNSPLVRKTLSYLCSLEAPRSYRHIYWQWIVSVDILMQLKCHRLVTRGTRRLWNMKLHFLRLHSPQSLDG